MVRLFEVKNILHKFLIFSILLKQIFGGFLMKKLIKTDIFPMRRKVKSDDYVPIYLGGSHADI